MSALVSLLFTLSLHPCCRFRVRVQRARTDQKLQLLPVLLSGFHNIMSLGDRCCRPAYKLSHDLSVLLCRRINCSAVALPLLIHSSCRELLTACTLMRKRKVQRSVSRTFCGSKTFYPGLMTLLFTISLPLFYAFPWIVKLQLKTKRESHCYSEVRYSFDVQLDYRFKWEKRECTEWDPAFLSGHLTLIQRVLFLYLQVSLFVLTLSYKTIPFYGHLSQR